MSPGWTYLSSHDYLLLYGGAKDYSMPPSRGTRFYFLVEPVNKVKTRPLALTIRGTRYGQHLLLAEVTRA